MTEEKRRILLVDDSPDDIHILMENLKPDYALMAATSGEKALALATRSPQPDVVLLDVSMPGMNGYETCRRLKSDPTTCNLAVIFVSAHDSTEEKLAGYEAGGSDYLIKPVQHSELLQKVKLAIKNLDSTREVEAQKRFAVSTAMTALTSAGEQGVVLDFMRKSFAVKNIERLARLIVEASDTLGLGCSVQIRTDNHVINVGSIEPVPPLEQELMQRLKDSGRILESGKRFFSNFGKISYLARQMPDDEDKCGRLRDHICMLLEGAEARLHALEADQELARLVIDCNRALYEINGLHAEQKEKGLHIMEEIRKTLEASFESYSFTDYQENLILDVVYDGVTKTLDNFEYGMKIDEQMQSIVNRLASFTGNNDSGVVESGVVPD